jgi:hypothetical protein
LNPTANVRDGYVCTPAQPVVERRQEISQNQNCQDSQAKQDTFKELTDVDTIHEGIVPEEITGSRRQVSGIRADEESSVFSRQSSVKNQERSLLDRLFSLTEN